jgi:hypothetical protein
MIAALSRPAPLNGASNTVKAVDEEVHVNDENELLSDDDQFKQLQTPLTPPELVKFEKFKVCVSLTNVSFACASFLVDCDVRVFILIQRLFFFQEEIMRLNGFVNSSAHQVRLSLLILLSFFSSSFFPFILLCDNCYPGRRLSHHCAKRGTSRPLCRGKPDCRDATQWCRGTLCCLLIVFHELVLIFVCLCFACSEYVKYSWTMLTS